MVDFYVCADVLQHFLAIEPKIASVQHGTQWADDVDEGGAGAVVGFNEPDLHPQLLYLLRPLNLVQCLKLGPLLVPARHQVGLQIGEPQEHEVVRDEGAEDLAVVPRRVRQACEGESVGVGRSSAIFGGFLCFGEAHDMILVHMTQYKHLWHFR